MDNNTGMDIAIIGMSARFPGAGNTEEFWSNLLQGVESITKFTDEQLLAAGVDPGLLSNPNYIKAGAVLKNIDEFDASFFSIPPREAEIMDPQHRIFLETCWETLEQAGYAPEKYDGLVGVYGACGAPMYQGLLHQNPDLIDLVGYEVIGMGNEGDFFSTRVAYKLNLGGPALTVQTACSSSLVAAHLACQALLTYECDMALAGSSNVTVPQIEGYFTQEGAAGSMDGHCRTFDAKANGTVFGSGAGSLLLKRLDDALADGDHVFAVIKGSAINNDGSRKVGFAAPSVDGQAEVIIAAQEVAGIEPESISYIEAHGTGTALGDPIELSALTKAFRLKTDATGYCAIGSVKTNIGHSNAAAGMAGLIKTSLALKHKQLPKTLNFEEQNPRIDFANSPFYVNDQLAEWKAGPTPRRAGVTALGFGGTNAHMILEEAPEIEPGSPSRAQQVLLLAAKTPTALDAMSVNLSEHLAKHPELDLADVAYTLQVGRSEFAYRRAVVAGSGEAAVSALSLQDPKAYHSGLAPKGERKITFMFPGQGAQYVNMGRGLYESEAVFRDAVDECAELLVPHLGLDLRTILYPEPAKEEQATAQLTETQITQPALFVIEYSLAKHWMSWGILPQAMIGHSIGEYVAACLAEVFSLEDALRLIAMRGKLIQSLPGGKMLAVSLSEAELLPLLPDSVSLAVINAPTLTVAAGPEDAIQALHDTLAEQGVHARLLHTSHAFHSAMMEGAVAPLIEQVQSVRLQAPKLPFLSNVTGTWITDGEATDPAYWAKHLRQTVRFGDGITELLQDNSRILLEIGPGQTLNTFVKKQLRQDGPQLAVTSMRHPQEQEDDLAFLFKRLGQLWVGGARIDWSAFYEEERRLRVPLPTYPFEKRRYWIDAPKQSGVQARSSKKRLAFDDWFNLPVWKRTTPSKALAKGDWAQEPQSCLLFTDGGELGNKLKAELTQAGHTVFTVASGTSFAQKEDSAWTIDPNQVEDYTALLNDMEQKPTLVLHLWGAEHGALPDAAAGLHEIWHEALFNSLVFLAQALSKAGEGERRLLLITDSLYEVTGEEKVQPLAATVLGAVKAIPQEYKSLSCRHLDLAATDAPSAKLVSALLAEVFAEGVETEIALRGAHRWVQDYEPVRLAKPEQTGLLQQNGVYLITGGLGGVGLAMAEHLAASCQAKLVLLGRSALPAMPEWEAWLQTHGEDDPVSQKIVRLQQMEQQGAELLVLAADVTDPAQMKEVVRQVNAAFGQLNGVLHAAGVPGGGLMELKTAEASAAVFAPKVRGTQALYEAIRHEPLDFFLLCSSLTALDGGIGTSDYCSANAFLDAFAHHINLEGGPYTVAVNWDLWRGLGMGEQAAHATEDGFSKEEGMEMVERILHSGLSQVAVSVRDLKAVLEQSAQAAQQQEAKEDGEPQIHTRFIAGEYVAPRSETEEKIAAVWQDLLGIDMVGMHDSFLELGGDSLLMLELASKLRSLFSIELTVRTFYEALTIEQLALVIEAQFTTVNQ